MISANPSSVNQNTNWVSPAIDTQVVLRNNGETTATITGIVVSPPSSGGSVSTSGCSANTSIASGSSCTLTVSGTYTASSDAQITVNYKDGTLTSRELDINVIGTYTAKPVVTANLNVTSPSLFNQTINLVTDQVKSYLVTLTNNSTATSSGDKTLSVPYASLLPANDTANYSINTAGITSNPCNISTGTVVLAGGTTCNYNLVITSGSTAQSSGQRNLQTKFNYNVYANDSTTPTRTGEQTADSFFNLATIERTALLSMSVVSGDLNKFNAIEQGISPLPTLGLVIRNTGTKAVNGNISVALPAGITGNFNACSNLGVDSTCAVTLSMPTASTVPAGNLSSSLLNYNNGVSGINIAFPSIPYSVLAPNTPSITMTETVTGCYTGTGTTSICYNNPNTKNGSASSMKVVLTFTNSSALVRATSLSLPPSSLSTLTGAGLVPGASTCTSGADANGGTCTISYNMPTTASSQAFQANISPQNFAFNYNYTTPQGQVFNNIVGSSNLGISINVVDPTLSIASINNIEQGLKGSVTLNLGNLYNNASTPSPVLTAIAGDGSSVSGLTVNNGDMSCTPSGITRSCSNKISTTADTPVGSYKLVATSNVVGNAQQDFNVIARSPLLIFITTADYTGNLGGIAGADLKCNSAIPTGYPDRIFKAMIVSLDRRAPVNGAARDWVLRAGTEYKNTSGDTIATANAQSVFPFNLINSISPNSTREAWTGMQPDWTMQVTDFNSIGTCQTTGGSIGDEWQNAATTMGGIVGNPRSVDTKSISDYNFDQKCNTGHPLYCVEQFEGLR